MWVSIDTLDKVKTYYNVAAWIKGGFYVILNHLSYGSEWIGVEFNTEGITTIFTDKSITYIVLLDTLINKITLNKDQIPYKNEKH